MAFGTTSKLRLESDGIPQNTKLIDVDSGEDLMQRYAVLGLTYEIEGREMGILTLRVVDVEAVIQAAEEDVDIIEDEVEER